jgi:hypothetical protein
VPDRAGRVFLLNCCTFELYTYDAACAKHAPDTVEIVLLVAAAPSPSDMPMFKLSPDPEGEAALACILDRDTTVIPLLENDFLGYALRVTEPDEELVSAEEAEARQEEKFIQAIRNVEAYVAETEEELAADKAELADLRAVGLSELLEQEGLDKDEEAHPKMRVHLEDAKEKLKALGKAWTESYGPWVKQHSQNKYDLLKPFQFFSITVIPRLSIGRLSTPYPFKLNAETYTKHKLFDSAQVTTVKRFLPSFLVDRRVLSD